MALINPFLADLEEEEDISRYRGRPDGNYNKNKRNRRRKDTLAQITGALSAGSPQALGIESNILQPNVDVSNPVDLMGHEGHAHGPITGENGKLDISTLASIGSGHYLQPQAAAAWNQMNAAYRAATGSDIPITDSYRDYATQVRLAQEKGLYSKGGLAAEPGTSNHGWGLAVDVGSAARGWLAENGARFGFSTIAREPWHWEYKS